MKLQGVQLVLDTNVIVHWLRGKATASMLRSDYAIDTRLPRPIVPVVVKGEALALASYLKWGARKMAALDALLRALPVADISADAVTDAYAIIDSASRTAGRRMGKNDVWIAAVSLVSGATLLTSDADFDHLSPNTISVEKY